MSELSPAEQKIWDELVQSCHADDKEARLVNYCNYYNNIRSGMFLALTQLLQPSETQEHLHLAAKDLDTQRNLFVDQFQEVTDWVLSQSDHEEAVDTWVQFVQDDERELLAQVNYICPAEAFVPTEESELRRQARAYLNGILKKEQEFMNPDTHKNTRRGIDSGIATEDEYGEWVLERHAAKVDGILSSIVHYASEEIREAYMAAVNDDVLADDIATHHDPEYDPEEKAAEARADDAEMSPLLMHVSGFDQARDALLGVFHLPIGEQHKYFSEKDIASYIDDVVEKFDELSRFVFEYFSREEAVKFWRDLYADDERLRAEYPGVSKDASTLKSVAHIYAETFADTDDDRQASFQGMTREDVIYRYRESLTHDIHRIKTVADQQAASENVMTQNAWSELLNDAQIALATLAKNLLVTYIDKKQAKNSR